MATNDNAANTTNANDVNASLTATLTSADTAVLQGLNGATLIHKARLAQQQRYAADLATEYGAQDPRVVAAQAKVTATQLTLGRLSGAYQQSTTDAPAITADEWALQGRIYDVNAQPLAQLTVFLVNGDKIWLRQYGFSYTDQTGLFTLQGAMPADATVPMYIEIANDAGLPIYLSTTGFAPVKGQVTYQNITLASQTPLGDPPQPIRIVGLPDKS
jgi:hypothetical protein